MPLQEGHPCAPWMRRGRSRAVLSSRRARRWMPTFARRGVGRGRRGSGMEETSAIARGHVLHRRCPPASSIFLRKRVLDRSDEAIRCGIPNLIMDQPKNVSTTRPGSGSGSGPGSKVSALETHPRRRTVHGGDPKEDPHVRVDEVDVGPRVRGRMGSKDPCNKGMAMRRSSRRRRIRCGSYVGQQSRRCPFRRKQTSWRAFDDWAQTLGVRDDHA